MEQLKEITTVFLNKRSQRDCTGIAERDLAVTSMHRYQCIAANVLVPVQTAPLIRPKKVRSFVTNKILVNVF